MPVCTARTNLGGLVRVLLFKRFESSVYAFQQTIDRLLKTHETFLKALEAGFVPAGEEAQAILYDPSEAEADLLNVLEKVSTRYKVDGSTLSCCGVTSSTMLQSCS